MNQTEQIIAKPDVRAVESLITPEVMRQFAEDGIAFVPGLLSPEWMAVIERGIMRNIANPGPRFMVHYPDQPDRKMLDDKCNFETIPEYQEVARNSPLADAFSKLVGSENVWLYFDQLWMREGGRERRTPWHQDTPAYIAEGKQIAVCWITLDPLEKDEGLEMVARSHLGPLYAFPGLDPEDETKPSSEADPAPILPDIENEREKWDIRSFASKPGDVLFFHPSALHGGGAIREGKKRRTLSLRLYGDDVVYQDTGCIYLTTFPGIEKVLSPGDPLRYPALPQLRAAE